MQIASVTVRGPHKAQENKLPNMDPAARLKRTIALDRLRSTSQKGMSLCGENSVQMKGAAHPMIASAPGDA